MSEQIAACSEVGTDDNLFLWGRPFQSDSLIVLPFGCHWGRLVSFCVCLHTRLSVSASAGIVWCTYVQSFCEGFQQLKHRFFGSPLMKLSVPASKNACSGWSCSVCTPRMHSDFLMVFSWNSAKRYPSCECMLRCQKIIFCLWIEPPSSVQWTSEEDVL